MITKNATKLNRKANQCKVMMYNPNGVYRIKSPSGETYTVDLGRGGICSCQWGEGGGAGCSHELCARKDWARRHEGRAVSFQAGNAGTVARQQHKATAPVAVQGDGAVTLVLRDKVDDVARLDTEIQALGEQMAQARRRWYSTGGGQVKADARMEIERLRGLLMEKQTERAQVAGQQMREAA